jgi:thioredoxin-related protein
MTPVAPLPPAAGWTDDYTAALQQAKAEGKLILLDFTSSDSSPDSAKMKQETFDQSAFRDYAAKNLVLVTVDFPKQKTQSAALKSQNASLKLKYGVESYPTFVLINAGGKTLGTKAGYLTGGPAAFLDWLGKIPKS